MNQLSKIIEDLDTSTMTKEDIEGMTQCFKDLFSRDASLLRSSMMFSLFFTAIGVDVTWLDEISEGLKHVTAAVNTAILNISGISLDSDPTFTLDSSSFVVYLQNVLRQISYTIGYVAGRLIQK